MRTDHILDQIDSALHDETVSGDAMRSAPDLLVPPLRRIIIHADTEATMARLREVSESIQAMKAAFTSAAEAAAQGMAAFTEAMRQPARPVGRPAWQSPYGPARRR